MPALQELLQVYKTAVFEKDVEKFASIFDSNLHVFDMWAQWSQEGLRGWRAMATEWFGSLGTERCVVEFDDVREIVMDDLATLSAFLTFKAVDSDGKEIRSLNNRLTWVAQKKNGRWKIVHEHTSGPVDHATLKVMLKRPLSGPSGT